MLIRRATLTDAEAINRIYNQYPETSTCTFDVNPLPLKDRIEWLQNRSERHIVLVADMDDEIVGWCSISPFKVRPAYQNSVESSVYIDQKHHGKGIGRALMTQLIRNARELGFHTIIAGATAGHVSSIRLHESLGFVKVAEFKEVGFKFGEWHDTVYLQLVLQ